MSVIYENDDDLGVESVNLKIDLPVKLLCRTLLSFS